MADLNDPKITDKRVAQRYVRKGILDEKDWDKHMKSLPDLADQALSVEAAMENDDLLDDEPDEAEPTPGPTSQP
jgi:hypothetical protein